MAALTTPSISVKIKRLTQSYWERKRTLEKLSGLDPSAARTQVQILADAVFTQLTNLAADIKAGVHG